MTHHPTDGNAIAADLHYNQPRGEEEGDICGRGGCGGSLGFDPVENCSCHINPPCGRCESNPLICDACRYEVGE